MTKTVPPAPPSMFTADPMAEARPVLPLNASSTTPVDAVVTRSTALPMGGEENRLFSKDTRKPALDPGLRSTPSAPEPSMMMSLIVTSTAKAPAAVTSTALRDPESRRPRISRPVRSAAVASTVTPSLSAAACATAGGSLPAESKTVAGAASPFRATSRVRSIPSPISRCWLSSAMPPSWPEEVPSPSKTKIVSPATEADSASAKVSKGSTE
ncbi:MAG: hypothetical protein AAGF23_09945, partial [Acidobacteriota bacterium]